MEITGQIKTIGSTQQVSDRFKKRELIIVTEANTPYPQYLTCQVTQDKCDLLNNLQPGDEVKALYNLRGRLWNSPEKGEVSFNTIELWRIEKVGGSTSKPPQSNSTSAPGSNPDDNDDLPFS